MENYVLYNNELLRFNNDLLTYDLPSAATYPTDGLVARWAFDGDGDDSYASYDLIGIGTPDYISGSATGAPSNFPSQVFDSSTAGGFFRTNEATSALYDTWRLGNAFSIAIWGRIDYVPAACSFWGSDNWNYLNTRYSSMQVNTSNEVFALSGDSGVGNTLINRAREDGWHHHVYTYEGNSADPSTYQYYYDGVSQGTQVKRYLNDGLSTAFGRRGVVYPGWTTARGGVFHGYLSLSYLYNKALDISEVAQLYNSGKGV